MKRISISVAAALVTLLAVALGSAPAAAQDGAYTFPSGSGVTGSTTCVDVGATGGPRLTYNITFSGAKTNNLQYRLRFTRAGSAFGSTVNVSSTSGNVAFPPGTNYTANGWSVSGNNQLVPGNALFASSTGVRVIAEVIDQGDGNALYTSTPSLVTFSDVGCDDEVLPPPTINVDGFTAVCVADAPYIAYDIRTTGMAWPGSATLTFTDINGQPVSRVSGATVDRVTVTEQRGRVVFPGAEIDAAGNPTNWPGWRQTGDGSWEPDPTDEVLRQGVNVLVQVNPEASVLVTYPPANSACANPPEVAVLPPPGPPPEELPLPGTGLSTLETSLRIGALFLIAGLGVVIIGRRRRYAATAPTPA